MSSTPEPIELAKAAIKHVLNTICDDPRKYWLLGNGTESYAKLTAAHAALHGIPVEKVRASYVPDSRAYNAYIAERKEMQRLAEIGAEHDQEGGRS